jgi:hypothetical protein
MTQETPDETPDEPEQEAAPAETVPDKPSLDELDFTLTRDANRDEGETR